MKSVKISALVTLFLTLIFHSMILSKVDEKQKRDEKTLARWKCDAPVFVLPESADPLNIEHAKLAVKANPERFEAYLILAGCYSNKKNAEKAVEAFEKVDKFIVNAPLEEQKKYEYEKLYSACLAVAAMKRCVQGDNSITTLRMFQKAAGMYPEALRKEGHLVKIFIFFTGLYLHHGKLDRAREYAVKGIKLLSEDDPDNAEDMELFKRALLEIDKKRKTDNKDNNSFLSE